MTTSQVLVLDPLRDITETLAGNRRRLFPTLARAVAQYMMEGHPVLEDRAAYPPGPLPRPVLPLLTDGAWVWPRWSIPLVGFYLISPGSRFLYHVIREQRLEPRAPEDEELGLVVRAVRHLPDRGYGDRDGVC